MILFIWSTLVVELLGHNILDGVLAIPLYPSLYPLPGKALHFGFGIRIYINQGNVGQNDSEFQVSAQRGTIDFLSSLSEGFSLSNFCPCNLGSRMNIPDTDLTTIYQKRPNQEKQLKAELSF